MQEETTKAPEQQHPPLKFAVYGTLKRNFGNNSLLRNAIFIGEHLTEPNYTMYNHGGFPVVVDNGETPIACEIWETADPATINSVNRLEGFTGEKNSNSNWYDRKTIDTAFGPAEMYVMHNELNLPIVKTGVWQRRLY